MTPPLAAGAPKVTNYGNALHVCYRDIDGNIQDIFGWPSPNWTLQQLSGGGLTPAPAAAGDPTVVIYDNQMHVIYRDRVGALQDVFPATVWAWKTLPISKFAAGDPNGTSFDGYLHVCYRDRDAGICNSFLARSWGWQQLTGPASVSGGLPAIGDPMPAAYSSSEMHVLYCAINSNLSDVFWDGRQWRYMVRI